MAEGNNKTGYFNRKKAKELFDSLPADFKKPGSLKCTALSGSVFVKEALVVKDQVKKALGVDLIEIEQVALSELATRRRNTDPKVWDLLVNWTITDDPYYIFVAFDGFNTSLLHDTKYYSKAAQEWIEKGNSLPNGPDRNVAYQNAQKEILKDMPRVPLVAILGLSACQKNIDGVEITPSGSFRLRNAVKTARNRPETASDKNCGWRSRRQAGSAAVVRSAHVGIHHPPALPAHPGRAGSDLYRLHPDLHFTRRPGPHASAPGRQGRGGCKSQAHDGPGPPVHRTVLPLPVWLSQRGGLVRLQGFVHARPRPFLRLEPARLRHDPGALSQYGAAGAAGAQPVGRGGHPLRHHLSHPAVLEDGHDGDGAGPGGHLHPCLLARHDADLDLLRSIAPLSVAGRPF